MRIGRTIIKKSGKLRFEAFRVREPKFNIKWVLSLGFVTLVRLRFGVSDKPRNWPCPCGSGKKFKKCCQPHAYAIISGLLRRPQKNRKKRKVNRKQLYKHPERHYTGRQTLPVK